jgi:DNA-binding transcriptional LysR family regulator
VQKCTDVDWDALQVFLTVARTGRISVAAKRLGVEHTTVSRRLSALEVDLGVPLFYRTSTGYLLTPHGQNVLANAEQMERAALAVAARAREGTGAGVGRVRIAIPPEMASHWLAPQLKSFRARHPHIELHILVGTRQRDLTRGEAEIAVQSPNPRQQGLIGVRIGRGRLALYASTDLVADRKLWIDGVATFPALPLLAYTAPFHLLQAEKWFQPILDGVAFALRTNSSHALLAAARAGAGIAVLPRLVARGEPGLVPVSDDVAAPEVWLITHPEFRRDPKVRATVEFLKRIAAGPNGLT